MSTTLPAPDAAGPRMRLETVPCRQAKADLKNLEPTDWRQRSGGAMRRALDLAGLSQKEAATLLERDAAQVARWIAGTERVQLDAVLAVPALRGPFVVALAALVDDIEVATTITLRRSA